MEIRTKEIDGKRYVCVDDVEKLFEKEELIDGFDKSKFQNILSEIYNLYGNYQDFMDYTGVDRGYLSRHMNNKLDNPPTPRILRRLANGSKGITTYKELMQVCGYLEGIEE